MVTSASPSWHIAMPSGGGIHTIKIGSDAHCVMFCAFPLHLEYLLKGVNVITGRFGTRLLPEGLRATGYSVDGANLSIDAEIINAEVICPGCGQKSSRRHGLYVRHLADFPAHGRSVKVRLSVHRFRCVASHCPTTAFNGARKPAC